MGVGVWRREADPGQLACGCGCVEEGARQRACGCGCVEEGGRPRAASLWVWGGGSKAASLWVQVCGGG